MHQQHQPHHSNQNLSISQQFAGQSLFSLSHHHANTNGNPSSSSATSALNPQQQQHLDQSQQATVSQLLDTNQQLVAHFNQHSAAALTAASGHFVAEGLSAVTDASQFVSVMQQQNPQLQDATSFNAAAAFFQQHHHHHHHSMGAQQHLANQHAQHHHQQHQQQQQHQPTQLTCASVMSSISSGVDNLSLATGGHVIIDPATSGLLRLHNGAGVVDNDQAVIVMNTINGLRQHQQQPRANLNSGGASGDNSSSNGSNTDINTGGPTNERASRNLLDNNNFNTLSKVANISNNNNNTITNNNNNNSSSDNANSLSTNYRDNNTSMSHNNNTNNNNTNNNSNSNNVGSNTKSSNNKSKSNSKKEKTDSQRNSESPRRTFACPTCGKVFSEKFNMKRHMQIHSQSRPKYMCNECSKSFAWKDNFIRHKKAAHSTSLPLYQHVQSS